MMTLLVAALLAATSLAAPATDRKSAPSPFEEVTRSKPKTADRSETAAATATEARKPAKELWNSWYTVTVLPNHRYGYYNDKAESRDGKLHFQNKFWKREEGYVNEEALGAIAEDTPALTPLFFNFFSTYRATETKIDGTVKDGKQIQVRITKAGKEMPVVRRSMSKGAIFSAHFPIWLVRNPKAREQGKHVQFFGILEDNFEQMFTPVPGTAKLEAQDENAKKLKALKYDVKFRGLHSVWYVTEAGETLRIEMPDQKTVVERVTKAAAEQFLEEGQ